MTLQQAAAEQFILKVSCEASSGIVAKITSFLYQQGCYISELNQFDDPESGRFFMRALGYIESGEANIEEIRQRFVEIAQSFEMDWQLHDSQTPTKTIIMVSKFDHCLDDLLYRLRKGELKMDITAIVSNHKDLRPMVEREGIRFIHLPISKETKRAQELELLNVIEETQTELVVLARYMQVLSDNLCTELAGRAINIHHSFLPGFKGAKPYHQAYARGVKLIGATAHYVTSDLDEGPIIEQAVQVANHAHTPEQLVAIGRDTETQALAQAVKLHTEHRVFVDGNKTVVLK